MTNMKKMLAAAIAAPAALVASQAGAQVTSVAVADPQAAIAGSSAYATARTQIETTYKAQIDQAQARGQAIQAELQPMVTQFQAAQKAPGATQASLQTQYNAIQAKQQAGQQEIARITEPAQRAQSYVVEQIQAKLGDAVQNVVKAKNIGVVVSPQAVLLIGQPAADITPAISAELNRLVPSVSTTPPAGWQPGQQGQQAGAGAAPVRTTAPASGSRRNGSR